MYGMNQHRSLKDYCATIRHADGASQWTHVRTNMGRSVAYAMIAKHFEGCKVESFRDETQMDSYDRQGASDSDGCLYLNPWAGHGTSGESYASAR